MTLRGFCAVIAFFAIVFVPTACWYVTEIKELIKLYVGMW